MRTAADNLKRIMEELAPYTPKAMLEEFSTAGTWRASDGNPLEIQCAAD
jgi:hypothetical protein